MGQTTYRVGVLFVAALSAVAIAQACSSKTTFGGPDAASTTDAAVTADIGFPQKPDSGSSLIVSPANVVLAVSGSAVTQQYTASAEVR